MGRHQCVSRARRDAQGSPADLATTQSRSLIYYSSTLFSESLKLAKKPSAQLAGVLNMVLVLGSFISIFLVDRLGRKPLLLSCISGMSLVFIIQTVLVKKVQEGTASTSDSNGAVLMLFLFMLFFSIGFQATVWMIPSEVLPLSIRTKGSALSTASNWVSARGARVMPR